jgi:RNA polymerase sigma-70 factor (ECF subfamily)
MDRDDLLRLYDSEAVRLRGWLQRELGDRETATDLTAETFARALVAMRRQRGGDQTAWLYGIARHLLADYRRRQRVEDAARRKLAMPLRTWSDYHDGEPDVPGLDELAEADREALELRIVDDLSYEAVAERLGVSAGAARMRVHRALSRLRGSAS